MLHSAVRRLGGIDTHLVLSRAAKHTPSVEAGLSAGVVAALATEYHRCEDVAAPITSGS